MFGLATNTVIAVAFLAVAFLLAVNLTRSRQWSANPLGSGTFLLYLTCGGGHAVHAIQLAYPLLGVATVTGLAAQTEYQLWHMAVWDALTAAAGVWYWTMRRRFPDLVSGAAVFEDLRERQRRALEIHDNIVQGLVRAQVALDLEKDEEGRQAVGETLGASRRIVTELLGKEEPPKEATS